MVPQNKSGVSDEDRSLSDSHHSSEKVSASETCRICQCLDSDKRGESALEVLGIDPPLRRGRKTDGDKNLDEKVNAKEAESFVESISPELSKDDLKMRLYDHEDALIELGCSCKNDLALVHYACALKWFVNYGSTVCEICGDVAKNIRTTDFTKVVGSLKEFEALREMTASEDPDLAEAIHRRRLSEISLWFGPHNNGNDSDDIAVSESVSESSINSSEDDNDTTEEVSTRVQRNMPSSSSYNSLLTEVLARMERIVSKQEATNLLMEELIKKNDKIEQKVDTLIDLISKMKTVVKSAKQSDQHLETPASIQDQPQELITEADQRTTPERQNLAQQTREAQMVKEHIAEENRETEHLDLDLASKQELKDQPKPPKRKKKLDGAAGEQSEDDPQDAFGEEESNVATVESQDGKKPIQTYMSRRKRGRAK